MGALAAIFAAGEEPAIQALALDSIPRSSEDILETTVKAQTSLAGEFAYQIACRGTHLYYRTAFRHESACEAAKQIENRKVLLLAGKDAPALRESTAAFGKCLSNGGNVQTKLDLQISGFNLNNAAGLQGEEYDNTVINFFRSALNN